MMTIQELNKLEYRYVRIRLDDQLTRYENENFTNLLQFIGKYYPIDNRDAIGCAYTKIRKETDKLLQVSWSHNRKLKTSKNEVKSIRFSKYWLFENKNSHHYIRIPYKISFIFTAIVDIVAEINKTYDIPPELYECVGKAYKRSFYNLHIEKYESEYTHRFKNDAKDKNKNNPAKLYDEFFSPASVFHHPFP